MAFSNLHLKVLFLCYAALSLPYVALALELRGPTGYRQPFHVRSSESVQDSGLSLAGAHSSLRDVVVNSTTVVHNIPKHLQEVYYFRNFTMVGKKSEGFNITQWEIDNNHPDRSQMTPAERLAAGDSVLAKVAAGVVVAAVLTTACVLLSSACGTYIGNNIGTFIRAVGDTGGQAAVDVITSAAGNAPPTLPTKRDYNLDEEFGCYYENGYDGTCANEAVTDPAFDTVANGDGADDNTPIWSCYESSDSDGTVFGFYSHCFADDDTCELQCGSGNPEDTADVNDIAAPSRL